MLLQEINEKGLEGSLGKLLGRGGVWVGLTDWGWGVVQQPQGRQCLGQRKMSSQRHGGQSVQRDLKKLLG